MFSQANWKKPMILSVSLLALGTFAYWLEYSHKPKKEKETEQSKKIFGFESSSLIKSIKIRQGSQNFEFECADLKSFCKASDANKWNMILPSKLKADEANVNALVTAAMGLTASDEVDLTKEEPAKKDSLLKEYKLDDSSLTDNKITKQVSITFSDGKTTSLFLGEPHPIGESTFGLTSLNKLKVYFVPNYFKSNLDHDLTHWRDKKLFNLATHDVSEILLSGSLPKLDGVQISALRKNGVWSLTLKSKSKAIPDLVDGPGDIENIDNFISGVTYLFAKDFASESSDSDRAKELIKKSKNVAHLVLVKDKSSQTVLDLYEMSGNQKGAVTKYYAKVSGLDPLFELDPSAKDKLNKGPKDFRLSKLITSMERYNFKWVSFSGPGLAPALELTQKDGKWAYSGTSSGTVDQQKVQEFFDQISGNRIQEFLTGAQIPGGSDKGVTLAFAEQSSAPTAGTNPKRKLVIWKTQDGGLFGKDLLSGRNEAFKIEITLKEKLPWDNHFFDVPAPTPSKAPSPAGPSAGQK